LSRETFPKLRDEGVDFLQSLLLYNPKLRITANKAEKHDYFFIPPFPQEEEFMPTFPSSHT